ncbi:MAG: thioredoxin family protein, partial [Phycisphaerales bacterium]|nr:thioredoxin family protein [Phycisphaerales bacterium]
GLVMSAGVVAFWLTIGGLIAFVGTFGQINQLFQVPAFVLVVGLLILVFGLGMLGLFSTGLPNWVYRINPKHDSLHGSFVFGIMTAVLSTPCTAPFMGAAAAWATLQPSVITLSTFASIGIGMALPYLVLSAFPKLVNRIPRTGPASELVKQVMGLFLIAVAMFFLGNGLGRFISSPNAPAPRWYWWFVGAAAVVAMVWMIVRTFRITTRMGTRLVVGFCGLAGIALSISGAMTLSSHGPIDWEYYDEASFASYFDGAPTPGKVLVVDFTAEWCLNCKALESAVLHQEEIVDLLDSPDVVAIKVDLTGSNPEGRDLLKRLEWVGIPLLAIYGPGLEEPLKFDSYGVETVKAAIE